MMYVITTDGTLIDTCNYGQERSFEEEVVWNGYAHAGRCSQHTAAEDSRQHLYERDDGYYLVEFTFAGKVTFAKRLSTTHAAKWLLYNNYSNLPKNLKDAIHQITKR